MTDEELGYDPTVAPAEDGKISGLMQHDCPKHLKELFQKAFLDDRPFIQQVTIRDRVFLIGELHFGTWDASGRGTKGYIAYDVAEKNLCYIKDSWRNPRGHAEHETYEILQSAQVQNTATCIVGEDFTDQLTRTQDFFADPTYRDLSDRIHHRIALREIGLPLSGYKNSGQLCEIVYDAFNAHSQAWKAGVLHRDINDSNIVIFIRDDNAIQGLLLDWDLCKYKEELEDEATAMSRSGTWAFSSALRLRYPMQKPHTLSDDLESFFYVITFLASRFHFTPPAIQRDFPDFIYYMYYHHSRACWHNLPIGGAEKLKTIQGNLSTDLEPVEAAGLARLIADLLALCHRHYAAMSPYILQWNRENIREGLKRMKQQQAEKGVYTSNTAQDTASSNVARISSSSENIDTKELVLDTHEEMDSVLQRAAESAKLASKGIDFVEDWPQGGKMQDLHPRSLRRAVARPLGESIEANSSRSGSSSQGVKRDEEAETASGSGS